MYINSMRPKKHGRTARQSNQIQIDPLLRS
jgi:hypothetical protein